jgi:hypothetical protein
LENTTADAISSTSASGVTAALTNNASGSVLPININSDPETAIKTIRFLEELTQSCPSDRTEVGKNADVMKLGLKEDINNMLNRFCSSSKF